MNAVLNQEYETAAVLLQSGFLCYDASDILLLPVLCTLMHLQYTGLPAKDETSETTVQNFTALHL